MSIVRVGLAETDKFAQGYDAIFAKRTAATKSKSKAKPKAKAKKARKTKRKK